MLLCEYVSAALSMYTGGGHPSTVSPQVRPVHRQEMATRGKRRNNAHTTTDVAWQNIVLAKKGRLVELGSIAANATLQEQKKLRLLRGRSLSATSH